MSLFLATRCALLLLVPSLAFADPPTPLPIVAVPPGDDVIVAVKKGDPVPFAAQCFDSKTALRWANWLEQYKYRLGADVAFQKQYDQATIDYLKKAADDASKASALAVAALQKTVATQHDQILDPPFYRSLWFGIVIGMVITGAAVGLAAVGFGAVLGK